MAEVAVLSENTLRQLDVVLRIKVTSILSKRV